MKVIAPPRTEAEVRRPAEPAAKPEEVKKSMVERAESCVDHLCGCSCAC